MSYDYDIYITTGILPVDPVGVAQAYLNQERLNSELGGGDDIDPRTVCPIRIRIQIRIRADQGFFADPDPGSGFLQSLDPGNNAFQNQNQLYNFTFMNFHTHFWKLLYE